MLIKELFEKDVNRNIETVIKADDRDHIADEVTEYVITNEISKKIHDVFDQYVNYAGANGVWISGFFGSGKSHLLKILSYVFENRNIGGYPIGELFAEKIIGDEVLKGNVKKASKIPSESILFNIDQQAQITSKTDDNALLSVFYKVFFDHLGYYGFQPHVAEFEMWLDKKEQFSDFKKRFEKRAGRTWEDARVDYFDPQVNEFLAEVLAEQNKSKPEKYEKILDELENKQKQSIEDLCKRIAEYISSKPKGFRLNFFVDEVGQYISENTKLMLNLQTISETLATKTKGAAWVFATSQDDMEKVVGDMNKKQQNDFSRIQARFSIKIPLTSANVDEVIERRLLDKRKEAEKQLSEIYAKESAHLESLLSFSEVGVQFKRFGGSQDFLNKYPFVPYQFDLFQHGRRTLSAHNAFQGRHASVGERSMLGVFQQVAKTVENKKVGSLASFDLMYEGIRNELRSEIQNSIILAERNLSDAHPLAVRVLKALFLVKYFSNFKATKRNVSVLMIDDIHIDIQKHEKAVGEALNLLENQSYVQRNGEFYEFLTDDEKDVERSIKDTDIDDQAITTLLKEIFFDEVIKDQKIRFQENKQDYDFTSKIDGTILGREKELEVEIITENNPNYSNPDHLRAPTMGSSCMRVVLPPDPVFMKDVRMYLRSDKYIRQNQTTAKRDEIKRIFSEKARMNAERRRQLVQLASRGIANSTVYMNGEAHELGQTSDGKTRVITAFQDLIRIAHPNLRMLGGQIYSEDSVKEIVRGRQDQLFVGDDETMTEAESEMLNTIKRRANISERTSLNDLRTLFTKKPYGWYPNAIWAITAKLYKRGKLEVRQDSNLLEDEEVLKALLNTAQHPNTLLEAQSDYDPTAVNNLKKLYTELFDESCSAKEAKDVAVLFRTKLQGLTREVEQLRTREREYPFMKSLEGIAQKLDRWSEKDYAFFLTNTNEFKDDLLDAKEDMIDPIKQFMTGGQAAIYDAIRKQLLSDSSNIAYVGYEEFKELEKLMDDPAPYRGNKMQQAKVVKDKLAVLVKEKVEEEKARAIESIMHVIKSLETKEEYQGLDAAGQKLVILPLKDKVERVKGLQDIARIRDEVAIVREDLLPRQLEEMMRLALPVVAGGDGPMEPLVRYVKKDHVKVVFQKSELSSSEDVDAYVEALRKALKERIQNNQRISLL